MEKQPLVVHRETRVTTVFSVCDSDGNLLFDQPLNNGTASFSTEEWARMRSDMERAQRMLRSGRISRALEPGEALPDEETGEAE